MFAVVSARSFAYAKHEISMFFLGRGEVVSFSVCHPLVIVKEMKVNEMFIKYLELVRCEEYTYTM